ncbi:MAG: Rieske 2Fe-2S domain-containing protein [Anaerolineae bacterium]|nr:Rieske 2Fe-2S domain-containing protein [Anaerolineae bacterium]MDW8098582.1 Rieske 2Fe-2S domain-containing protein [Anaerolineae bacterium]
MAEATLPISGGGQKFSRRELLNYAWLASLGILLVNVAGIGFLFAMPRFKEGEFGGVFTLGRVSDLPPVGSPPVNYPKGKFWLTRTEQGVLALYKVCTHLGCLYGWNDQEGKFICPCHGSQFAYDGTYLRGPAPRSLDRFVVQLVTPDGQVLAETDPERGGPLPVSEGSDAIIRIDTGRKILGQGHA